VERLQPAEIARLLDALPYLHAAELLTLISDPRAADTLEAMSPQRQKQVFLELDDDQANRLLALMAPENAADLLGCLDTARAERYLGGLPEPQHGLVVELLRYPDDTAGGIMTNDVVMAPGQRSVREARELLREQLREPDFVYYVWVVNNLEERQLLGEVTLRRLLVARDEQRLEEAMRPVATTIDPLLPAAEAARQVAERQLAALPVVTREGRLLGAITADAAFLTIAPASVRGEAPRVFS
jgi:Mg/Co/Ni transporter MgtE